MKRFGLLPYDLQFFAEPDSTGGSGGNSNEGGNSEGNNGTGDQNQNQNQNQDGGGNSGKTFTQDEVNAIGAREKNQGKSSILKLFGCTDEKDAKAQAEAFKKWREDQKSDEEKRNEAEEALKNSAAESEKRATAAENKLTALTAGVTAESLDDALAIALLKVTDEKPLDKVFAEMKKEPRYSGFFGTNSSAGGTGSSANHNRGNSKPDNYGKRLAEQRLAGSQGKSNFFNN